VADVVLDGASDAPIVADGALDSSGDVPPAQDATAETSADAPPAQDIVLDVASDTPVAMDVQPDSPLADAPIDTPPALDVTLDAPTDAPPMLDVTLDAPTDAPPAPDVTVDAGTDSLPALDATIDAATDAPPALDVTVDAMADTPPALDVIVDTVVDAMADTPPALDVIVDTVVDAMADTPDAFDSVGCTPLTCADFPNAQCGVVDDGCGGTLDLVASCAAPGCTAPDVCGGSGAGPTACASGCKAKLDCSQTAASNAECGLLPDNCGGVVDVELDCGKPGCSGGEVCGQGSFSTNRCIQGPCTPKTCAEFAGMQCGLVPDGCGGILDLEASCGAPGCAGNTVCGAGGAGANICGLPNCAFPPLTCADFQPLIDGAVANGAPICGVVGDTCGGTIDLVADCGAPGCGTCTPGNPLALQCANAPLPTDALDTRFCIENGSGCPGEVVHLPIHVLAPTSCVLGTSQRSFLMDMQGLELVNELESQACGTQNCSRRDIFQGTLDWIQFSADAIGCAFAQCPAVLPVGQVDNLVVRIPPSAPSGDISLMATNPQIYQPCQDCGFCQANLPMGIWPTVRVF